MINSLKKRMRAPKARQPYMMFPSVTDKTKGAADTAQRGGSEEDSDEDDEDLLPPRRSYGDEDVGDSDD